MTAIARKTMIPFGSTAGTDQISQFGSLAASAPAFSTDPAVIQNLAAWLGGWFPAVIGLENPAIEDWNAVCFVLAYQLCSIFQDGIPQWDSGTSYTVNSFVRVGTVIYYSLQDNNTGHTPSLTDVTWWSTQNGSTFQVTSETTLAAAITACTSLGGGIITIVKPFTLSTLQVIPAGTKLTGKRGGSLVTVITGGRIQLATSAVMQDVFMFTTLSTSINMLELPNEYATIQDCQFTVLPGNSITCVSVTGSQNRMFNNVFAGVAGEANSVGINYRSGVDNFDHDSVFLP